MILEWLESIATPCPPALRAMGYGTEIVAIGARYRRCADAWAEHIARSRQAILTAIGKTKQKRTAIVMGSGRLIDVPLKELAQAFERVVLVDAVHPLIGRLRARAYKNVELLTADVTGTAEALHRLRPGDALPVPKRFELLHAHDVDLVVSLNILSQLGVLPVEWIERQQGPHAAAAAQTFARSLTRAHLDDLARCAATVCLIADVEWRHIRPDGTVAERGSSIYDVPVPPAAGEWVWPIAPAPEDHPTISEERRVIVAYDVGQPEPSSRA
jgi:hypothetical protein